MSISGLLKTSVFDFSTFSVTIQGADGARELCWILERSPHRRHSSADNRSDLETLRPCVRQLQNDEASVNINWFDVVKERNYRAEYKGDRIYHFRMRDEDVIVQLSAFQHNMVLSGLPRELVQLWSYERDVQTEPNTLALTAEMVDFHRSTLKCQPTLQRSRAVKRQLCQPETGDPNVFV